MARRKNAVDALERALGVMRMGQIAEAVDSYVVDSMERETGLEPVTSSLGSWHSTTELLPLTNHAQVSQNKELVCKHDGGRSENPDSPAC